MTTLLPLTPSELADLKAKAKAATPGPWEADGQGNRIDGGYGPYEDAAVLFRRNGHMSTGVLVETSNADHLLTPEERRANCEHIATANPDTILRLIDMVERHGMLAVAAREKAMRQDEAERLARDLLPNAAYHDAASLLIEAGDLRALCDHILSGSYKREIENAAFERAAKLIDRQEKTARKGTDAGAPERELAYRVTAASVRALIQPPAQKGDGE